ncbi:hypothetical protein [Mucilaginibacter myungsuensis]|uniref:GLPGLI family protein n=1 Tax=Mucilaginibacter myungsuensis TaxID=649104 RepID=A0A929L217_9SPHI|nr:hypothetical protein [Mucilaginibacter myungsuensis]MBE9664178.1 hypothetical protein [Mucilaginibacter myungsuensis]MDN3599881.1 hypothetical protein [Mucilaginibacter myungsuensis]
MKFYALTLTLAIGSFCASAQSTDRVSPYVFPQFVKATVLQKGGGSTDGTLNYNTFTQEMMFMQGSEKAVLEMDNVDTIYLEKKKFVPVGKLYYEKLTDTKIPLYVQHLNKKQLRKDKAEFDKVTDNMNSGLTAANGFVKAKEGAGEYDMLLPEQYMLQSQSTFWLQNGKNFVRADSQKNIAKAFPGKEKAIADYIKENNIDLKKLEDMAKLIVFCNK